MTGDAWPPPLEGPAAAVAGRCRRTPAKQLLHRASPCNLQASAVMRGYRCKAALWSAVDARCRPQSRTRYEAAAAAATAGVPHAAQRLLHAQQAMRSLQQALLCSFWLFHFSFWKRAPHMWTGHAVPAVARPPPTPRAAAPCPPPPPPRCPQFVGIWYPQNETEQFEEGSATATSGLAVGWGATPLVWETLSSVSEGIVKAFDRNTGARVYSWGTQVGGWTGLGGRGWRSGWGDAVWGVGGLGGVGSGGGGHPGGAGPAD